MVHRQLVDLISIQGSIPDLHSQVSSPSCGKSIFINAAYDQIIYYQYDYRLR